MPSKYSLLSDTEKQQIAIARRVYYLTNRESILAQRREAHRRPELRGPRLEKMKERRSARTPDQVGEVRAYMRDWNKRNLDRIREQRKNPKVVARIAESKHRQRLKQYGLTAEQHKIMVESQDGRCAICRADHPGTKKDWCIDHDHTTGKVRGILCFWCNCGLGHFKDNLASLAAAISYLS
jgi:hypothetical protein